MCMCVLNHFIDSLQSMDCSLWIVAYQVPLSMGLSRQEYWSGLTYHPSSDLLEPGIEPMSPTLAGGFFTAEPSGEALAFDRKV